MKKLTYLVVFYIISGGAVSQNEIVPPDIEFENLIPNWFHISNDTNYIIDYEDTPWATTFSHKTPVWLDIHDGHVYIFEQSSDPKNGLVGFSLYKLNAQTGELIWELFDNYNNGLEFNINYFNNSHYFDNGELNIYGYSSLDTISLDITSSLNGIFYYGRPIQKKINLESGAIVQSISSNNEIVENLTNFTGPGIGSIHRNHNENLFQFQSSGTSIDSFIHNEIYIHKINNLLEIDSNFHYRISYNTEIRSQELSLVSRPLFKFLSDSTFVSLNVIKNVENISQSPKSANIDWWSFNSDDSISFVNQVDITDFFYKQSEVYKNLNMYTFGDNIIINQLIEENETAPDPQFSKLIWFNNEGMLIRDIEFQSTADYRYSNLRPLFIDNNILYFAAYFNDSQFSGSDIFMFDPNNLEPIKIGAVKTKNVDNLNHPGIFDVIRINQNNVLLSYRFKLDLDIPSSFQVTHINYYFNINLNDIGISTSASSFISEPSFEIYPNPSQQEVTIDLEENMTGEIIARDYTGRLAIRKPLLNEKSILVEIGNLKAGVYFISIVNTKTGSSYTKQFIKF